ncbi:MAG: 50S ribosomal protein L23 [Candidatus Sumerlaeota bacterium]|nr:50S ribosomal protein L23 [Candidatus Sumerlaeota bacterium]
MKTPFEILERPVITEKASMGQSKAKPQYTFKVSLDANKHEVKKAVELAFPGVKVSGVNSMIVKGKWRRLRQQLGKRPDWKKVIVTLAKDSKPLSFY